ncbi:CRISPR-associated endoribonuclease Cas6 [Clostridium estertheticum]|uniref:CRISPR-associated endoribonuclease Cas6 n=1 Tax=Clostridium estertheticum TaxID=238834 RepID=UPI001C0C879B|nr:CRISPR-associated endoribonuclease Cas6 [Clostridium estertheticum]MBU3187230.1 CRISPR-associated endoribonuclease Cas6 [Clostridium estertheticum]MCB2358689.1 CRISPR-associated endoribonuclease Cas6 [Clostridium estertheticum]
MKVWELALKVYLKKDIPMEEGQIEVTKIIDNCLTKDEKLLNFHSNNQFKNYTFSSFYPIKKNKIYLAGEIYTVTIRTVDESLVKHFQKFLDNENSEILKALTLEIKTISRKYIERIYSITPVVAKFDNGYWRTNESIEIFEERLKGNLIKKYNDFTKQKINEEFDLFTFMRFDNQKPIATKYKEIKIIGDKITLNIAENKLAQELAYFAIGTGLLEMNGRGFGFVNYKWL